MLELVVENVLVTLAGNYEKDPAEFCHMSNEDLASVLVREAVAELRNEGYVEEQVRGVVRFTRRGYKAYRAGMSLFQYT